MSQKPVVAETLESLLQLLQESFGGNLISIVHYGPLSGQDLNQVSTADVEVKVLIVVESLDDSDWGKMSQAFDRLRGRAAVAPVLLTEKSLKSSTDVFPILIREMKNDHQLIHGKNVVADLEVQRSHLRLRCEQELRSLQLRMQSICLMHFASPHRLRVAMVRDYRSFEPLLKIAMMLSGTSTDSTEALMDAAAEKLELEAQPLALAMEFANGNGEFNEETFGNHYIELMTAVRMAANFVDQLPAA